MFGHHYFIRDGELAADPALRDRYVADLALDFLTRAVGFEAFVTKLACEQDHCGLYHAALAFRKDCQEFVARGGRVGLFCPQEDGTATPGPARECEVEWVGGLLVPEPKKEG